MSMPRLDLRLCTAAFGVVCAGALTGAAIGKSPMMMNREAAYPSAIGDYQPVEDYSAERAKLPPDHYPLVTPKGTIPVAELSLHGRLRNKARAWWDEPQVIDDDYRYADQIDEGEMQRLAEWTPPVRHYAEARHDLPENTRIDDGVRVTVGATAAQPARVARVADAAPPAPRRSGPRIISPMAEASPALALEAPATLDAASPTS